MNAILGYSEMLMEDAEDQGQEDFIPDLQKIHTAGKHLLGLINEILDLYQKIPSRNVAISPGSTRPCRSCPKECKNR